MLKNLKYLFFQIKNESIKMIQDSSNGQIRYIIYAYFSYLIVIFIWVVCHEASKFIASFSVSCHLIRCFTLFVPESYDKLINKLKKKIRENCISNLFNMGS